MDGWCTVEMPQQYQTIKTEEKSIIGDETPDAPDAPLIQMSSKPSEGFDVLQDMLNDLKTLFGDGGIVRTKTVSFLKRIESSIFKFRNSITK